MAENEQTFKFFNHGGEEGGGVLPLPLASLLAERQIYRALGAEDLREMSKFGEIPNMAGLAAHPVSRPAPAGLDPEATLGATDAGLSENAAGVLRWELIRNPCVAVEGALAGAAERPFRVAVIVPQSHAHLAQAMRAMLWAPPESSGPFGRGLDYVLFIWPGAVRPKKGSVVADRLIMHRPDERMGMVIGYDDPALAARMLTDAARRRWAAELPAARVTKPGEGCARVAEPGGEAEFRPCAAPEAAAWDEVLIEPEALTPLWANPMLPAAVLAANAEWRAATLAVGALPLGVAVDNHGRFPVLEMRNAEAENVERTGWVVVPRSAMPAPFLREARRYPTPP